MERNGIMERNGLFFRMVFLFLSCLITTSYEFSQNSTNAFTTFLVGITEGFFVFSLLVALEIGLKRLTLRSFNTALVGIAVGTLMGFAVCATLSTAFSLLGLKPAPELHQVVTLFIYLTALYFGIIVTYSASEMWWLSIPFMQLTPAGQAKRKELLLDLSALEDTRLTDLAKSGLIDHQLVLPAFVLKEVQKGMEALDEATKTRFRKCFEHIKRLENMPALGMQQREFHTSELDDLSTKLFRTAKLIQAHILTSDQISFKLGEEEDVTVISLEAIANAIKPSAQRGEVLSIKIQRPGKEPKQGVGYLEDGTMVVVNGGGEFLGETIRTQVLSQKYSSSGKIIFCNALPDDKMPMRVILNDETQLNLSSYTFVAAKDEKREEVAVPRLKKETNEKTQFDPWNRH